MPSKMSCFTPHARRALVGPAMLLALSLGISSQAMARSNLMSMTVALKVENSCTVMEDEGRVKCRCSDHRMPNIEQRLMNVDIDVLHGPRTLITVVTW